MDLPSNRRLRNAFTEDQGESINVKFKVNCYGGQQSKESFPLLAQRKVPGGVTEHGENRWGGRGLISVGGHNISKDPEKKAPEV